MIREITEQDAEQFLALGNQLDRETKFMLLEPGERVASVEEQRARIHAILEQENATTLIAEDGGQLVGFVMARGGTYRRNYHSASIVAGVLQSHAGQGIGTRMLTLLERWARARRLRRLELTVMAHNERGIALYKKMGFRVEGLKKNSLYVEGRYVDEYYMGKILD